MSKFGNLKKIIAILFPLLQFLTAQSQCTTLGQTPGSAFPVCGTGSFSQVNVPICATGNIPTPCNDGFVYQDLNPFWYKFHCFVTGPLGFTITPNNLGDDYDWQLFDVTNQNPNDVFTNSSLFVACNWSGLTGVTGASAAGNGTVNCAGTAFPLFNNLILLQAGHDYLLLVSHFTNSQSGYSLSFTNGSNNITDTVTSALLSATVSCDATQISIKLNKKMKCNSLAANGSDFIITGPSAVTIVSASSAACSNSFDMDSVVLVVSGVIPTGNYSVAVQTGSDGNTLLDNCQTEMIVGASTGFTVAPFSPPVMDSIASVGCAPRSIKVFFDAPIKCSSIAPDGSDFVITGTTAVIVTAAAGNCSNGLTTTATIQLSVPLQTSGNYLLHLVPGSDGNTILDQCNRAAIANATLPFSTVDTVSALFNSSVLLNCDSNVLSLSHNGLNGVNDWQWTFNGGDLQTSQNVIKAFPPVSQVLVQLIVSNGVCKDTATNSFDFNNGVHAAFITKDIICPEDPAVFQDQSTGTINSWNWTFANGNTDTSRNPAPQFYPRTGADEIYTIRLIINNINGCKDTAEKQIKVLRSCYIDVPSAFTPNNDGRNDYLYPLNAFIADDLDFKVYNRWGILVFHSIDYTFKWDGKINGKPQEPGTYIWILHYVNRTTGKKYDLKGTSVLIR